VVKEKTVDNKTYYRCEVCNFYFKDMKRAKECEDFCKKNNSCNVGIIKYAVKLGE